MASAKEIQIRMKSIRDTMKITSAMYMISSSKMKKAKKILEDTEPYFYSLRGAIRRIQRHVPNIENQYFDMRPEIPDKERKVGIILVTGDKGLAGAYNHNIIRMTEEELKKDHQVKLYPLGMVGRQYFDKKDVNMDGSFRYTVQNPSMHRARLIAEEVISQFLSGNLDEVYIIYTRMEGPTLMIPKKERLLPLRKKGLEDEKNIPIEFHREEIRMIPSPEEVLNSIVPNYLIGRLYGCLVEAYASENNSRMMAMESSTNNAKEMLKELSIAYNRARQAAITQEITEVISGARAQKRK